MNKILLVDNYDSFTYNLLHLVQEEYDGIVDVIRNDSIDRYNLYKYEAVVISPGPGRPETTPYTMGIIHECYGKIPILGECLGMQCLNEYKGGKTVPAPYPVHGKRCKIDVVSKNSILFDKLPTSFYVGRYHSLQCSDIPTCFSVISITKDNIPMAIEDKDNKVFAVQFHPESFLSDNGAIIVRNFLEQL